MLHIDRPPWDPGPDGANYAFEDTALFRFVSALRKGNLFYKQYDGAIQPHLSREPDTDAPLNIHDGRCVPIPKVDLKTQAADHAVLAYRKLFLHAVSFWHSRRLLNMRNFIGK